ncbi:hypothetical protein [Aeromonas media]|uniref:hypothetical protein n=1 Tax=Aeromonas media TaxID=651 RepID=UPI000FB51F47
MDATQLYLLSIWYKNNVTNKSFLDKYSSFIQKAQYMIKHITNQQVRNDGISEIIKTLNEMHGSLDIKYLMQQESDILSNLGLNLVILNNPASMLNDIIYKNNDLTSLISTLIDQRYSLELAGNHFTATEEALSKFFGFTDQSYIHGSDKNTIKIHFKEQASISNIAELKSWSDKWYKITRGLSGIIDGRPEDFVVSGASSGSVIFDVVINNDLLNVFQETITHIADATAAYFVFKQTIAELKSHANDKETDKTSEACSHLEAMIESRVNESLDQKINEMIKDGVIKNNTPEAITNYKKSVHDTQDFLEKGGDFDLRTTQHEIQSKIKITQENIKKIHKNAPQPLLLNDDETINPD